MDLVAIQEIKEDTVVMKDGGMRQIIMVGGVNFALKSESEQSIMTQAYQNFLNGIDFPLQVVIHSRKVNIDKYVESLLARKDAESSPLLQNQIQEYAEFIKGFVQKNAIMEKVFLIVIPFYPITFLPSKKTTSGILSFFGKKKPDEKEVAKDDEEAERVFGENLAQLSQRTSQAMSGLLGIGLETTVLNNEQLVELFYNFYNPQTVEREHVPMPQE